MALMAWASRNVLVMAVASNLRNCCSSRHAFPLGPTAWITKRALRLKPGVCMTFPTGSSLRWSWYRYSSHAVCSRWPAAESSAPATPPRCLRFLFVAFTTTSTSRRVMSAVYTLISVSPAVGVLNVSGFGGSLDAPLLCHVEDLLSSQLIIYLPHFQWANSLIGMKFKINWILYKIDNYFILNSRGIARILVRGGREASDKISNKVARISVRGSDIQQKFTQQRLLKNFEKFI